MIKRFSIAVLAALARHARPALLATLLGGGAMGTASAQEFVANQIEGLISTDTMIVEIEGLTGALSGSVRIEKVTVADPGGVFLTASDLAMDWSPFALVRANVEIEALTAGQIVLERLPASAPADPNAEPGSGLPAITADIQRIAITEFVIGEAIAGVRARLSAEAKLVLADEPTRLEVSASVQRLDQPGQIATNLVFAPADNRLEINVNASEPAGGLVATLLEVPGAPAVELTVGGSGPLSDFMANGALTVGGEAAATVTAQVTDVAEGRRVAGSLSISAERFVPVSYAAYVDGGVDLDAEVLLRNDGIIAIDQGSLQSGRISARASGTFDRAGPGTALDVSIEGRDGGAIPLRFGAEGSQTAIDVASLRGTLRGALSAADIALTASLPTAGFQQYVATDLNASVTAAGFDLNALTGPLRIEANAASVAAPEGLQDRFLDGPVRIVAEGALGAAGITLGSSLVSTGVANAAVTGTAALTFSTFDLTLTSDFETLALSAAAVPLAGDRLSVSGRFGRAADGTLSAGGLAVRGTGLTIDGSASLGADTVLADVTGSIDVAATETSTLSGQADFALKASGPIAAPDLDLSLTSRGLRVSGRELANLKAEARGAFTSATPSGTVEVSGTLDGVPLSGTALVETLPNGERRISNLAIRQDANTITGALRLTDAVAPIGTLDVALADVGPLAALALQTVDGDLNGTITLSVGADAFPVADVDLRSTRLAVAGTTLIGAAIDLSVADYLGSPSPAGSIKAERIDAGGAAIADLSLDLSRRNAFTRVEAAATANGIPVTLAGQARVAPTETTVAIDSLTAAIPDAAVALAQPATIVIRDGVTELGALTLQIGAGSLSLSGTAGSALDLEASLTDVPAALANPFVEGLDAVGTISGTASATGPASAPEAAFDLRAAGIETSQTRAGAVPPVAATLAGTFAGGTLSLSAARVDLGGGSVEASGSIGAALDLQLTLADVPVALANGYVGGLGASGTVSGTASATGPIADPAASFTVTGTGITATEIAAGGIPPIELDLAGRYAAKTLTLERGRASVGSGSLTATGTLGDTLDLDVRLIEIPVGLANGFVPGLRASGTISGSASATGALASPAAVFDITGTGITAAAVSAGGIPPAQLRLAGSLSDGTVDIETGAVTAGEAVVDVRGTVGRTLRLSIALNEVPVAFANAFVPGLSAEGEVSGVASATGSLADPAATFSLNGRRITEARIAASGIAPLSVDVAGRLAGDTLTIEAADLTVGEGSLVATGTIGDALDLTVTLDAIPVGLANGFVEGLDAEGTISGKAVATGSLADPTASFQLTGTGITAAQVAAAGVPPVALDLDGRYAGGTATLNTARVIVGEGSLTARGTIGETLNLDLALTNLPVGLVNGFVPDLNASGTLSGTATASGSLADPAAAFQLTGTGITTAEVQASGIAPIALDAAGGYADGVATIERAEAEIGDGSLRASGTVGRTLDVDVTLTRLPVGLANGFVPDLGASGTLSGTASATGALTDPVALFDITASDLATTQTRAAGAPALDALARGRYQSGTATIETARIDVGGGSVTITGRAGRTLALEVSIADFPASLASAAAPGIDPTGTLDGTVSATGSVANPTVVYDLRVRGLTVAQTRDAGIAPLSIDAAGRYAGSVLTLASDLSGGGLAFRAGGSVNLAAAPQLNLSLTGTAPLAIANRVLAEGGRSIQGTVAVDIRVAGPASAPDLRGTVSTSGASFVDTGANVAVNGIAATITLAGQTATIGSFSARLAAGGTIGASGTIGLSGGFPANIRIQANEARYNDGELIAATVDAALTITGELTGTPLLAGTVDSRGIDIIVPERLPTSLARIDVTHKNASAAVYKQQREIAPKTSGGGAGGGIALDVTFNAPNEVFVRGRGLDIELGGSIRITGTAAAPGITGAFELRRGRFVILANRLDFERGILTFSGDLLPTLDLLATSQAGDVTVQIAVTGPATDPSFNFSSSPALPQDEVLARLIFGQGTADLSPLQIAQLAEAAAQLAGVGGSTGLLENLRSQLGVDDLDIRTTADGQTAVGVGKYLNDNTYLGVDSTGRVAIDLDLGAGFKARGAVSASGGGEVGVFYENEY